MSNRPHNSDKLPDVRIIYEDQILFLTSAEQALLWRTIAEVKEEQRREMTDASSEIDRRPKRRYPGRA